MTDFEKMVHQDIIEWMTQKNKNFDSRDQIIQEFWNEKLGITVYGYDLSDYI